MTSSTSTDPTGPPAGSTDPTGPARPALRRGTALGLAPAVAATTTVFTVGNLGAPVRVVTGQAPDGADLGLGEVVVTTVVAVLAGAGLLWLLDRYRADGFRLWVPAASAVAVLSAIPLWRLDIDAGSKLTLTAMHLATGCAAIAGHALVRRTRAASPDLRPAAGTPATVPSH